jgi:hypothetical protein
MSSLTIDDIKLMEQVVRICQQRGAFHAGEMVEVGNLYKKLSEILEKVLKPAEEKSNVTPLPTPQR